MPYGGADADLGVYFPFIGDRDMDNREINWKRYFSYFKYWFLAILLLAALFVILLVIRKSGNTAERTNQECNTQERVFDYADVLTDDQEDALRTLIEKTERRTACDIVLVILDESLADYAEAYEDALGRLEPYQYTMVYADNFYDEHKFGYDKPHGDGVLLLDNWYREADGGVYSWLSTCGRAEERFSSSMIDALLTEALANVEQDPYGAYVKYVNLFAEMMTEGRAPKISVLVPLAVAVLGTALFAGGSLKHHKGSKTVNPTTYVEGGKPELKRREDIFLRKTVTKRHIERSSGDGGGGGGGGGGHHTSSGGVSHGGGGHRR